MSSAPGPDSSSPATARLVGLPADGLAHMLNDALGDGVTATDAAPPPARTATLPAAFAKDGTPYSLDDLLSGLPPVDETAPPGERASLPADTAPPMSRRPEDPAPADATEESRVHEGDATTAALNSIASALEALARQDAARDGSAPEGDDDVLLLTEEYLAEEEAEAEPQPEPGPVREPEWDPTSLSLGSIVAALHALAEDEAPPKSTAKATAAPDRHDTVLATDEAPTTPEPAVAPEPDVGPEPEAGPEPGLAPPDEVTTAALQARIEAIIAAHLPAGLPAEAKGERSLPPRLDALEQLLADPPPASDFAALDALYACWPRATQDCPSRALLAVALNLSRNFGLPGRLPMASAKAWRMLSPRMFETELAQRLANVGTFIAEWQKAQRTFLILEFSEIELIEYLFEALHPGHHAAALAAVMQFKVLSNRRMGLLRRMPVRMKKLISPLLPDGKEQALVELAHAKALLEQVTAETGFVPIAEAAAKAQEEIEKMMKAVANIGAPPPPPGGLALGRIG